MEVNFSDSLDLEFKLDQVKSITSEFEQTELVGELSTNPIIGASMSTPSTLEIEFGDTIPSGGIDVIKVNGVPLPVVNRTVDIHVPTEISELINDSDYISDPNYVHTDNNFTDYLKSKLENVGEQQIYKGSDEPTRDAILIWIDTGESPVVRNAMITADDKYFITSDDLDFVPKEEEGGYSTFVTSDNNYFITSDDLSFMVADSETPLYTSDNKQFIDANDKQFITKGA